MKIYSREDALKQSIEYFGGDELAAEVFISKYAMRNEKLELKEATPDQMHRRLSKEFARIESKYPNPMSEEEIFNLFDRFKYVCITGDTWITTSDGPIRAKDLVGKPFIAVVDGNLYRSTKEGFYITGKRTKIYKITTKEGYSFRATANHKAAVHTNLGDWLKKKHYTWKEVGELKKGDKLVLHDHCKNWWEGKGNRDEGWLLGNLYGDGTFKSSNAATLSFMSPKTYLEEKEIALKILNKTVQKRSNKDLSGCDGKNFSSITSKGLSDLALRFGMKKGEKNTLVDNIEKTSYDFYCGFLSGWFDADGTVSDKGKDNTVRLSCVDLNHLYMAQRMLARLGVISTIYKNRKDGGIKDICGKIAHCKSYHDLVISKKNVLLFKEKINFQFRDKREKLEKMLESKKWNKDRFFARIEDIVSDGEEDVYDCTIPEISCFDGNGFYLHNCPQGSPMFGIGNPSQRVSLSNCFVIDVADSYGGICRADERIAQISKRRGGVGLDISAIRPKGLPTKNSALTTDGIVVFMERFSNTSREVAQAGRRGALMLSISVHHPEVLNFIRAKRDLKKVTGANISVKITDEFMRAVNKKDTYEQRWPVDSDKPSIKQEVKAKEIWDELVKSNWMSGEPGILFWDTIIKNSPADSYTSDSMSTTCTNPSLRGDTLVLTDKGVYPIKWIAENISSCKVLNIKGEWQECNAFKSGENKELVKITFTNRQIAYCTKEHKWPILHKQGHVFNHQTGGIKKKEASALKRGDKIYLPSFIDPIDNIECKFSRIDGFVLGWNQGDGWISNHIACNNVKQYGFIFNQEDCNNGIANTILNYTNKLAKVPSELHKDHDTNAYSYVTTDKSVRDRMDTLGSINKKDGIPMTVWKGNKEFVNGYVDGIFSSDGYVDGKDKIADCRVVLVSSHEKLVNDLQKLLSFFGIKSVITKSKRKSIFPKYNNDINKLYTRYDLVIYGMHVVKFANTFNLSSSKKQKKLSDIKDLTVQYYQKSKRKEFSNTRNYTTVKSIEYTGIYEDVYDITVFDDTHTFLMECGITGNCGELPLSPGSSCILLLQNLASYVLNPFTKEAKLNEELLKTNTRKAQRLIDDMVDLEIEAISKIIEKVKSDPETDEIKYNEINLWTSIKETCVKSRRTGLGVTGLGDCLAMLNIKYGSKESLGAVDTIFAIIRNEAYRSSVEMAKERGVFPIWDAKKEKDNKFLNKLPKDIHNEMAKVGRRNISCLTVPPAGSISTLTQTTSGFEPVYMAEYIRKRKLTENDKDKADFVDKMGDKWKNYKVEHRGLKLFKQITNKELKDSPYFGAQAEEIDYEARVKMQGIATSYVDHAISSTINLPNDADVKTVEKLYQLAYEEGCKGLTIYRDGSRDGVLTKEASTNTRECDDCDEAGKKLKELVQAGNRPTKIILSPAPKRSNIMPCEIHRSKVGKGDWLFFVGMLDGQPYETFGGNGNKFSIPHKYDKGWIIKNGKNKMGTTQYHLVLGSLTDSNEKLEFKDINKHFNNNQYGAQTRLVSLLLRHGTPIRYICEQITKTGCAGDFFSFQRAMARILKKYIADGEKSGTECPICKSIDVYYKNGCPTCKICGNSNCS